MTRIQLQPGMVQPLSLLVLQASLPPTAHSRFNNEIVPAIYAAASKHSLDGVGMVAQAAIETGWGQFPSMARPEYHNTCGLKWHDPLRALYADMSGNQPRAHAFFANWRTGAEAHAFHLLAYLKWTPPVWMVNPDPRFDDAFRRVNAGDVTEWTHLTGRWAEAGRPGEELYGNKIERIRARLMDGSY